MAEPPPFAFETIGAFWLSRAVWAAARLHLADAVAAGADTIEALAARTVLDRGALERLMAALAGAGVFTLKDGRYGLTETGDVLRSDHPGSQRAMLEMALGGEHYEAWGDLETVLKTGATGMDSRFGATWIEYYREHPERARLFAQAMSDTTAMIESVVLAAHAFPAFDLAVDVGGSHGSLVRRLLAQQPEGRGIVFDLPEVVAQWTPQERDARLEPVAGDFFERVPEADLYLLKFILHDWADAEAARILRTLRRAARPQARVAVIENLLPAAGTPHAGWGMDLNMLVITGGRERSAEGYGRLLADAGFQVERVTRTDAPVGVVQAIAV